MRANDSIKLRYGNNWQEVLAALVRSGDKVERLTVSYWDDLKNTNDIIYPLGHNAVVPAQDAAISIKACFRVLETQNKIPTGINFDRFDG